MITFLKTLLATNDREVTKARQTLKKINDLEPEMQERSYEQMQERIEEMRTMLRALDEQVPEAARDSLRQIDRKSKSLPAYEIAIQKKLLEFMPEVYAMVREIMRRELNRRHFDVQIIAGIILAQGQRLTELKTGEGKTQVFQLPLILYSLVGRGAHLVTVNDYLARRDGEYAGLVASKLGLTVGIITPGNTAQKYINNEKVRELKGEQAYADIVAIGTPGLADMKGLNLIEASKREAYGCDITVGVNNEFGFDYLRDNMATEVGQLAQRELYFCIVDEADSILVDEARTPLIISALPEASDTDAYKKFAKLAAKLVEVEDYTIDHKTRSVILTEAGLEKAEKSLDVENIWLDYKLVHHLENALKAKTLYIRDDEYIVRDGEVFIVDSFTGRVMPGRRYSEGIHQAIEAKEGVAIQQENKTMATITFQNFFRLYKFLCGGSGTILTEAEEFFKIYSLESVEVPSNRPIAREDKADLIYRDQKVKYQAVAEEVKQRHETGQPVLVGTTSVEKSENLSRLLDELGVPHEVLNAKYHEREAQIVARAGERGAVTVATNMAGRGTDIPVTDEVKELGGLAVIGTERHEARRIDNQLRGRTGRQGDPGYSRFYVALDDEIMRILGGEMFEKYVGRFMQDDAPIEMRLVSRQIESAQKKIEGVNFDIRKSVVDYDDVLNKHREVYYSRRKQILSLADKSLGVSQHGEVDEVAKAEARADLEARVRDILEEELTNILNTHTPPGGKLTDEEALDALYKQVLELIPDTLLATSLDLPFDQLEHEFKNKVRGTKADFIKEFLTKGIEQATAAKFAELNEDFPIAVKAVALDAMNRLWMEHLETMDDIRHGIRLQAYAQRDPLVEYKTVGFQRFNSFINEVNSSIARRILKLTRVQQVRNQSGNLVTNADQISDILTGDREMIPMSNDAIDLSAAVGSASKRMNADRRAAVMAGTTQQTFTRAEKKVGRNDLCPCGSGKKYKQCGLINSAEHQANMRKLG